ncbi:hypothetical protein M422DRAFT_246949 [Sphaerobolus stellatus SS14]|nr:hypothetical protein M422DRAFT_246949 [Sphaerobolus stellatus SS14]
MIIDEKGQSVNRSQTKYGRSQPFQLGLWATGQVQTVTSVFLPVSSGYLDSLDRAEIARLIPCPPDHLEIVISPFSILFGPEYHIVCAYDAGPKGLLYPFPAGIRLSNAPGDLCSHAVHMTRSLVYSFGFQINGNAIFFYLKAGQEFLAETDFIAVQAFLDAWNEEDADCSESVLKHLPKVFHETLKKQQEQVEMKDTIEKFSVAVFPALDEKPFITKQPLRYVPADPEEFGEKPIHTLASNALLGGPNRPFLMEECPLNQSIKVATGRTAVHPWAGNIVVLKERSSGSELCEDITDEDVEIAAEYFSDYGRY